MTSAQDQRPSSSPAAERVRASGTAQLLKSVAPRWAKEAARPFMHAYGRATWRQRPLPDYLIIGTKRGGSTSMFKYLTKHPNVLPPWPGVENHKKTNFFDQNYDRGEAWYRSHFPTARMRAQVAQRTGHPAITGEGAINYMFFPHVIDRVRAMIPEVRLVVVLRNPVDRAWSHYHERVKAGTEPLSFREALRAEDGRLAGEVDRMVSDPHYFSEPYDLFSYRTRGCYLEQLEPWLAAFEADQLLIVRSEDLYSDPVPAVLDVQRFLGLPEVPLVAHRYNYIPTRTLEPDLRQELAEYYRPHVAALEARLDRSFGWEL